MSKLAQKMQERLTTRAAETCQGIEKLLSLRALDREEYMIFQRTQSLLLWKIDQRLASRSPEDALRALLATAKRGFCSRCWRLEKDGHDLNCPNV